MRSEFVFPPLKCLQQKTLLVEGNVIKLIINQSRMACRIEKTIPISTINFIEIRRKPGYYPVGFIKLSIDDDSMSFIFKGKKSYKTALRIREYINKRIIA